MISKTNMAILLLSVVIAMATFVLARSSHGQATTNVAPELAPYDDRPRWGRIDAMARWLNLSEKQRAEIDRQDPTFWRDVIGQREQLGEQRDRLAKLLEDSASTDQQITDQVERSIALGNEIERRVTKHLLLLRKHLTPEQQKKLFGLAASGVRERMSWCGQGRGGGRGPGRGQGGFRGRRGEGGGGGQGFGGQDRGRRGHPSTTQCYPHDQGQGAPRGDRSEHETSGDWSARSGEAAGPSSGFEGRGRGRGHGRDGRGQGQGRGRGHRQQGENR